MQSDLILLSKSPRKLMIFFFYFLKLIFSVPSLVNHDGQSVFRLSFFFSTSIFIENVLIWLCAPFSKKKNLQKLDPSGKVSVRRVLFTAHMFCLDPTTSTCYCACLMFVLLLFFLWLCFTVTAFCCHCHFGYVLLNRGSNVFD